MNATIDSFLGWPNGDEYPDSEYASSRLYISQLIGSMDGSTEVPATNLYPDTPIAAQQYVVNYCISNQIQFPLDGKFKYYKDLLSEYMKAGHPTITTINSMVLSTDDPKVFDEIESVLQAKIRTDIGEYFVYLVYEKREDIAPGFRILDMVKLS